MKSLELLKIGGLKLEKFPSGKIDSMELLIYSSNLSKIDILKNIEIGEDEKAKYLECIERRLNGEPIQKILGGSEFLGVTISFNDKTLSPRQETEILADLAIKDINNIGKVLSVLDLCSGSGCIGLAIKKHTTAKVTVSDISDFAISHIEENSKRNNIEVDIIKSDMFNNISGSFDIIISNPPYLKTEELLNLEKEVELFDPKLALDGGADGLYFYKEISNNIKTKLNVGGNLYLEIHYLLGNETKKLFENKFENVKIIKDYGGMDRFVVCYNRKEILW